MTQGKHLHRKLEIQSEHDLKTSKAKLKMMKLKYGSNVKHFKTEYTIQTKRYFEETHRNLYRPIRIR